jgi:hypothetical protein
MEGSNRGREEVFETPDDEDALSHQHQHQQEEATSREPESVVPTPLDPDAAFEVFHGKRYETRGLPGACVGSYQNLSLPLCARC